MKSDQEQTSRYYAYFNYFLAIQNLLNTLYPSGSDLVQEIKKLPGYKRLQEKPGVNRARISELLRNSWFTWGLLEEIRESSSLTHINSPWSFVQSYYAILTMLESFLIAKKQPVHLKHANLLRTVSSELSSSKSCFPAPWSCVFDGDPKSNPFQLSNYSQELSLSNPLKSPDNPWEHYGLFLKTTRRNILNQKIQQWKKREKRKKIYSLKRQSLLENISPTTIFDAMYRMRIRSNYQDIDSFAFGVSAWGRMNGDSQKFHRAVLTLTEASLLVFEVLIARLMGKKLMIDEMKKFASSVYGHPIQKKILEHSEMLR